MRSCDPVSKEHPDLYFVPLKSLDSSSLHSPPSEQSGWGRGPSAQAQTLTHIGPHFWELLYYKVLSRVETP